MTANEDEMKKWASDIDNAIKLTKKTRKELKEKYYKDSQWSDSYTEILNRNLVNAQDYLERALTSIGGYWFYTTKLNPQES